MHAHAQWTVTEDSFWKFSATLFVFFNCSVLLLNIRTTSRVTLMVIFYRGPHENDARYCSIVQSCIRNRPSFSIELMTSLASVWQSYFVK